jgi:hypothetical protein
LPQPRHLVGLAKLCHGPQGAEAGEGQLWILVETKRSSRVALGQSPEEIVVDLMGHQPK